MRCSASLRSRLAVASLRPLAAWGGRLALAALLLPAVTVSAQSQQYTAPGGGSDYELPTAASMEERMEQSRWRLGPVRLAPWIGLRGLTYDDNVRLSDGEVTSDVNGSVGAGLTAILPTGSRLFWIAQVLPEYSFWLDLSERNELLGRYGGGVVADLNRLRLVANAYREESQRTVTIESPERVVAEREGVSADAILAVSAKLDLVAAAHVEDVANRLPGDDEEVRSTFSGVDRRETLVAGGVRFKPRDEVTLGVGYEILESDFESDAKSLSNTSSAPYAEVFLDGNRLALSSRVAYRELDPDPTSNLVAAEELTGYARLRLTPGWRVTYGLYGHRNLAYSLFGGYSHLVDDRIGAEIGGSVGRRLSLRGFYEVGEASYERLAPTVPVRDDDITAYGFEATYELGEWLRYRGGFHQLDIDSDVPGFDLDYARVTSTIVLSSSDWVWR